MNALLLPIRVVACAVDRALLDRLNGSKGAVDWCWQSPDYSSLAPDSPIALASPWGERAASVPPPKLTGPAVCVSWSLPTMLERTTDRPGAPATRPTLPERWLVVRLARRTHSGGALVDEPPQVATFVVDAGMRDPDGGGPEVLTGGGLEAIGRVATLATSPAGPREPLTAHGTRSSPDFTFAAHAPSNLNNLSFIDRLSRLGDLSHLALSYLVIGWYEDLAADPVQQARRAKVPPTSDKELRAALGLDDPIATLLARPRDASEERVLLGAKHQDLTGDLRDAALNSAIEDEIREVLGLAPGVALTLPPLGDVDRCVLHGMVCHVDYWNGCSYLGPYFGAPGSTYRNTCKPDIAPAVPTVGLGGNAEEALACLLSREASHSEDTALSRDVTTFALALMQDTLDTWDGVGGADRRRHAEQAARFERVTGGQEWIAIASAGKPKAPRLEDAERLTLLELNRAQAQLDEKVADRASVAENLYSAWWMLHGQAVASPERRPTIAGHVAVLRRAVEGLDRDIADARAVVSVWRDALAGALADRIGADAFELKTTPNAPFYAPREPAVALRDLGPRLPSRALWCVGRRITHCATAPIREGAPGLRAAAIGARLLEDLAGASGAAPDLSDTLVALGLEAALAESAAAAVSRGDGRVFEATSLQSEWASRMVTVHDVLGGAAPPVHGGTRRDRPAEVVRFGTKADRAVPFGDVATAWIEQPWLPLFLDWDVTWAADGDVAATTAVPMSGRTILAHQPRAFLADRLRRLRLQGENARKLHSTVESRIHALTENDVIGQTLNGFHQQLLGRDDLLPRVLPVAAELPPSLVRGTSLGPPSDQDDRPFFPVRGGAVLVKKLRVVDRFGQVLGFSAPSVYKPAARGDGLALALDAENPPGFPRSTRALVEPHRLRVEIDPGERLPGVCGWVLPSLLDHALVFYDEDGIPVGMLSRRSWRELAERSGPATPLDDLIRGLRSDPERFTAFMAQLHLGLRRTLPSGSRELATPAARVGRPLALLRVDVRLERRGGPAADPVWLRDPKASAPTVDAWRNSLPPTPVNVQVGARGLPDDGVLGYWVGTAAEEDDARWADVAAAPMLVTAKLDVAAAAPRLTFEAPRAGRSPAIPLLLLLDPRGRIYLEPDVLPVSVVSLDPAVYEETLLRLPAVLRVTPVLLPSHASLRAALAAEEGKPATLNLPVLPTPGADAGVSTARFLLPFGHSAAVAPLPPPVGLPDADVAAADGVLIL